MVRRRGHSFDATFDTEAEARRWAEKKDAEILAGKVEIAKPPVALMLLPDLMDRYAREVSIGKDGARWEKIRLKAIGKCDLFQVLSGEVDGALIAEWRERRLQQVSAATVNRELNLISAVFTQAIKEWRLAMPANPVHLIKRPKQPPHRTRRVSDEERADIIKNLGWDGVSPPVEIREWIAWGFCFALEAVVRTGEILRLTWQHIHVDRKFAHLPKTKNGDPRDVPLSTKAVALIAILKPGRPEGRVVPVTAGTFGAYFRQAIKDAGIEDMHFHDTRREIITRIAPRFSHALELAGAVGHRDTRSLKVYYEPDVSDLADKMG